MAEYNIDNLSQDEILDLISSKFTIKMSYVAERKTLHGINGRT